MAKERILRNISVSVPIDVSHGITMKEVPPSFVNPWKNFFDQICKNPSEIERPDFIKECPLKTEVGIPHYSDMGEEKTWLITRNTEDDKSITRKVIIKQSRGAPNVEEIELIEINKVKGSTGSRRVIVKYDPLECSIKSVVDERVIITRKDWLNDNDELEVNRIIHGWNPKSKKPLILESEINVYSYSDGLISRESLEKLFAKMENAEQINTGLSYPDSWLSTCMPTDTSLMC